MNSLSFPTCFNLVLLVSWTFLTSRPSSSFIYLFFSLVLLVVAFFCTPFCFDFAFLLDETPTNFLFCHKNLYVVLIFRRIHGMCFLKKEFLKNFANFTGKHPWMTPTQVISCEIYGISKNTYFEEQLRKTASALKYLHVSLWLVSFRTNIPSHFNPRDLFEPCQTSKM